MNPHDLALALSGSATTLSARPSRTSDGTPYACGFFENCGSFSAIEGSGSRRSIQDIGDGLGRNHDLRVMMHLAKGAFEAPQGFFHIRLQVEATASKK